MFNRFKVTTEPESLTPPVETTPLNNQYLRNNQPETSVNKMETERRMDGETKRVLTKVAIDVVVLCCGE